MCYTDMDLSRKRLELSRLSLFPSLAKQSCLDFQWLCQVSPHDPLLLERKEMVASLDGDLVFCEAEPGSKEHSSAWVQATRPDTPGPVLTTRIDDDDAFAIDAVERLHKAVEGSSSDAAWTFPQGYRLNDGKVAPFMVRPNNCISLLADSMETVFSHKHRQIEQHYLLSVIDEQPGWLWTRHDLAITRDSGRAPTTHPPGTLSSIFPVDMDALAAKCVELSSKCPC